MVEEKLASKIDMMQEREGNLTLFIFWLDTRGCWSEKRTD